MSAIIAIYNHKTLTGAMAADSCWSGAYCTRSNPKIRSFGPALVASAGSMAHIFLDQLAEMVPPDATFGPGGAADLAERWREWCIERGHYRLNDEHGCRQYPACFLVLTPDGLFEIDDDGESVKHPPETTTAAIGIGTEVCMGAVHGIRNATGAPDAEELVGLAVRAAIDLCDGCSGPVQVLRMDAPKPVEPEVVEVWKLVKLIEANDIDRAIKECNAVGGPLATACKAVLVSAHRGEDDIRAAFDNHTDGSGSLAGVRNALLERLR